MRLSNCILELDQTEIYSDTKIDNLEDLETFIDHHYDNLQRNTTMEDSTKPNKKRKTDSSTDTDDLQTMDIEVSLLDSINQKLGLLPALHAEIKDIGKSLEFAHAQIETLQKSNRELSSTVRTLTNQMSTITAENKQLKETLLDLQTRSMRDNLIFTGLQETAAENTENVIKDFMKTQLKILPDTVSNITFHRVHRFGKTSANNKHRPIVAKFEHFQHKLLIQKSGKELKGTHFGINEQYPKEINERRKVLYPIMKEHRRKDIRASLVVDRLYINGQLFRDSKITPWLL